MYPLGLGGQRGLEKFRRPRRQARPGSGWGGSRGCGEPTWVLTRGREATGGRVRRRLAAAAAAGGVTPASWQLGPGNKRKGKLRGVLGQAGAARVGVASGRRVELAVGTTGGDNGGLVARYQGQCTRRRARLLL
jgi:hypothetical protein